VDTGVLGEHRREAQGRAGDMDPLRVTGACEDLTGRDAHGEADAVRSVRVAHGHGSFLQLRCRSDGSQGVVFTGDRQPEDRGRTAVVGPVDDAAVPLDRPSDDFRGAPSDDVEDLRIEVVGGCLQADTEHGDHAAGASRRWSGVVRGDGVRGVQLARHDGWCGLWLLRPRRFLGQDGSLEVLQLRARVQAELIGQIAAGILIGLERVPLATIGVQGEHQQTPQALATGLVRDETAQLRDRLAT
jgi:hypothetical protein